MLHVRDRGGGKENVSGTFVAERFSGLLKAVAGRSLVGDVAGVAVGFVVKERANDLGVESMVEFGRGLLELFDACCAVQSGVLV